MPSLARLFERIIIYVELEAQTSAPFFRLIVFFNAVSQLMTSGMAKGLSEQIGTRTHCVLHPCLKDPRVVK